MKPREYKVLGTFGTIGLEFVLCIVFGYVFGRWLDRKLDTEPWLMGVGSVLGVAAAFRGIFRAYKQMREVTKREEEAEGNPAPMYPKPEPKDEPGDETAEDEDDPTDDPKDDPKDEPKRGTDAS